MEKINYLKSIISIYIIITMMVSGHTQSDCEFYIQSLRQELFKEDCDSISIFDIIKKTDDRYENNNVDLYQLDSTKYVLDCQPDAQVVLEYLDSLMMMGDLTCFVELTEIYERQLDLFLVQWEQCYMDNYYEPEVVYQQYRILTGFEMVIRSLNFKKDQYTDQQIFDYYVEEIMIWDSIFRNLKTRCKIVQEYDRYYSKKYRDLNPCKLFSGHTGFHYLDPYKLQLKDYFIDLLYSCEKKNDLFTYSGCNLVAQSEDIIYSYNDQRIANFFVENYEYLLNSKRVGRALSYAGRYDNSVLSQFLLAHFDEILDKYPELDRYSRKMHFFMPKNNDYNLRLFLDKVIEIGETDPAKSKKYYSLLYPERAKPILEEKRRVIDTLLKKE